MVIIGTLFGQQPANAADPLDEYNVVWKTPSKDHNGSMPIGNGETGLNLWIESGGDLVFLVSRTDSWDGNERLCKLGRVRIKFTPSLAGAGFKQALKLRQGEIEIVGGAGDAAVTVRVWVDANRQVAHVEAHSAKDFQMQVALETWRNQKRVLERAEAAGVHGFKGPITVYPDTVLGGQDNRIAWYHRNTVSTWKGTLELQFLQPAIQIGTDPLLHRTFGGVIRGKGLISVDDRTLKSAKPGKRMEVSLHTETVVPATEAKWLAAVEKNIAAAEAVPLEEARAAHRKWWNDFWNRSWVRASGNQAAETTTRGYVLQRWINAGGGRGRFPIKFNGSIFTVNTAYDPDYRRWGGCYWFQNTRLPYWPMLASGDHDLMRPLFRMFRDAIPLAKIRSNIYFDHEGISFPETMSFWGTYDNGDHGWGRNTDGQPRKPGDPVFNGCVRFYYTPTLELLAMMIDYYAHTRDAEFLKNEMLPFADECLVWWDKHWPRDDKGKLKMYPSNACETSHDATNPTPDVAGLIWDLDGLLKLSDAEIGAERRVRWKKFRGQIPPIPMSTAGRKQIIAPAESNVPARRGENPELYAIFPFRIYGVDKPGLQLARDTFAARVGRRSPYCWSQDDTQAAFLGLARTAADHVAERARTKHNPKYRKMERYRHNRFPAFWGPNYDWVPDQDHGGNLLMVLQTMLLQADNGKIL
ncbi:MAG: DUF5703 domain-containing protein, partial [Thermoguttaceae bacterium]